ncbi:MAG: hypothetical protein AAF936_15480 [Pseudomonadota bacterium]
MKKFVRPAFLLLLFACACTTLDTNSTSIRTGERTLIVTGVHPQVAEARELSLLRAAQETLNAGYPYFEILRERENRDSNLNSTDGYVRTGKDKDGNEYEEYVPPTSYTTTTYTHELEVRVYSRAEAESQDPVRNFLYDARLIYDDLAPRWIPESGS